jgi:hypothetical protein
MGRICQKSYKPADDVTWNVTYVREPCRCMMTIIYYLYTILTAKERFQQALHYQEAE